MNAPDNEVDLSTSPQAEPAAKYTGLGRELYVANARFLSSAWVNTYGTAMPNQGPVVVDDWAVRAGGVNPASKELAATGNMSQVVDLNGYGQQGEIAQELYTTPGHRVTIKLRAGHNNYSAVPEGMTTKFAIQVNDDASTRRVYNLGRLDKLISNYTVGQRVNYWHEVTYVFRAQGYDVLQFLGHPETNNEFASAFITEVRAFESAWDAS